MEKEKYGFEPKNRIFAHFYKKIDVSHRKNDKFYMVKENKSSILHIKTNIFNRKRTDFIKN